MRNRQYGALTATWPSRWQPEADAASEPLVGSDRIVETWVGDPKSSISGSMLEGYVCLDGDGHVVVIHDRSGRPDAHPSPLIAGPVLRLTARIKGHRRQVIFAHPDWSPPG